jgi:beta-glucosidase
MFHKDNCTLTKAEIESQAQALLDQMTLKEKVWLLNGNWHMLSNLIQHKNAYNPTPICTNGLKRLGISPIKFTDGPRGVVMGHSTCFPVSMARGASFDRTLEERIGDAIGKEARAQGANYFGGVCINLLRHPAWGRAQETYGEDPYHLGEMGVALTKGVQAHNVMACLKHYAMNNIENSRFFVNVHADERTLREVYLPHFKKGVEAGAASLMGAYNLYEGDQACESRHLLTEILRDEWGFEGFTISDFIFGVRDTQKAIEAGLDVEMPLPIHYQKNLLQAVEQGRVDAGVVDQAARRVIRTLLVFEHTPDTMPYTQDLVTHPEHIALAREAAEQSMVLIKNENECLPLDSKAKKVLVLGKLATQANTGDHGSSRIEAPYVVTPLEGLKAYLNATQRGVEIIHLDETQALEAKKLAAEVDCVIAVVGNDYHDEGEYVSPGGMDEFIKPVVEGYKNMGKPIQAALLKSTARLQASQFTAQDGSPVGGDRQNLSLKSEQAALIKAVAGVNPNTVVCLVCGSMIMIDDWADDVPAILYAWYAGMAGGHALARVLFGEVNPSGKLPFTIPAEQSHLPYFSSTDQEITYDLYHGYTLLDKNGHQAAYPFGFGLSYTEFAYSDLRLERQDDAILVRVTVTNTGTREGAQVVQVYAGMENSKVERQAKLLKGFAKVSIPAGSQIEVTIPVQIDELRYYSIQENNWVLEPGRYTFMVGPDSQQAAQLSAVVMLT